MPDNQYTIIKEQHSSSKLWLPTIIVSILAIILLIFAVTKNSELSKSQKDLLNTQSQLSSTSAELLNTKSQLTLTNDQLSDTQTQLTSTQTQLASVQSQLTSTSKQLSNTQTQLTTTQGQLASTNATLTLYQNTWGTVVASGVEPRFLDGAGSPINLVSNPVAINPTWAQVQSFILADNTDRHAYIPGVYVCGNYAQDVYNNAEKAGIRTAWVAIKFADDWHACDAFKTTDRGLIFIDCTGLMVGQAGPPNCDKTVNVGLGKNYIPMSIIPQAGWQSQWGNIGSVLDVQVYW